MFLHSLTDGGMRRGGCREDEPITRYKPCQRDMRLQIALKPPWCMTACCTKPPKEGGVQLLWLLRSFIL
jgi:hypothetical protein